MKTADQIMPLSYYTNIAGPMGKLPRCTFVRSEFFPTTNHKTSCIITCEAPKQEDVTDDGVYRT